MKKRKRKRKREQKKVWRATRPYFLYEDRNSFCILVSFLFFFLFFQSVFSLSIFFLFFFCILTLSVSKHEGQKRKREVWRGKKKKNRLCFTRGIFVDPPWDGELSSLSCVRIRFFFFFKDIQNYLFFREIPIVKFSLLSRKRNFLKNFSRQYSSFDHE